MFPNDNRQVTLGQVTLRYDESSVTHWIGSTENVLIKNGVGGVVGKYLVGVTSEKYCEPLEKRGKRRICNRGDLPDKTVRENRIRGILLG